MRNAFVAALTMFGWLIVGERSSAAEATEALENRLQVLRLPGLIHSAVGVTAKGTPIPCVISRDDLNLATEKRRLLIVGGLDPNSASSECAIDALRWFHTSPEAAPWRERFTLSIVPNANPDRRQPGPAVGYPPQGEAYAGGNNPEAAYLWRWIGMHAPDLVIDLRADWTLGVRNSEDLPKDSLVVALTSGKPCNTGAVPAEQTTCPPTKGGEFLSWRLAQFKNKLLEVSAARRELQSRLDRTPLEVAEQLAKVYGHDLSTVAYIPAVAVLGRVRLGELTGDKSQLADVERIVSPYLSGSKPTLGPKAGGSEVAGHILWGVLADATGNRDYVALAKAAADRGFDDQGRPKASMPAHSEMSDAVFMGCPILAQTGRLTGDKKYFDMCLTHMRFMNQLNVRADGLHRHSPLDETAWGRGNGFPALGLSLSLSDMPEDHPGRAEMLAAFRSHIEALVAHQDYTGCWHQVVDHPESYRELSCTCMITFALIRGMQRGWLEPERYEVVARRGWEAIRTRVAADGSLVDVCTGTGKQKSLRDYYDRGAILGRDPRGGAMSLLVSTELAAWERNKANDK